MALGEWLDRIGGNFSKNWGAAGPQGLASLGAAIASAPRGQLGAGIAQGLAGFSDLAQKNRKKASLAEALKGAIGGSGFSPQQQAFFNALGADNVETVLPIVAKKLFDDSPSKSWSSLDLDKDGRPDVQIDAASGKVEAYPLSYKDRAYNMLFESGISPVAPGIGVDPRGNIAPMPGDGAPPQLRPSTPDVPSAPPAPMAEVEPAPASTAPVVSAPPNGQGAPTQAPIILGGDALKRMNLGSAKPGFQWALDRQTLKPTQVPVPGVQQEIPGEIAARIGLSTDFFKDADFIVQKIKGGATTGVGGQINLALGRADAGKVWRLASDGSDAMQRLLTGAGMPASEAANYVARFLPAFGDTMSTQIDKVENLTRRLKAVVETAGRGRLTPEEIKNILGVTGVGDVRPNAGSGGVPSKEDLEFTAKKHGISVEEVKRRLGGGN